MTQNDIALIKSLPCWKGEIDVTALEGGITNHNYKVIDQAEAKDYVVRLGHDIPVHHIERRAEITAGQAAYAAGLSPAIQFTQDGVLVMDYIESRPLTATDVQNRGRLSDIIELVRQCHTEIPKFLRGSAPLFWVFHVVRDYAATLKRDGSNHKSILPDLLAASTALEAAASPFDICFGHNDLLAANLLDDGERLWLIDWEYAGFNTPLFDLGGLASNNGLEESDERWLLEQYYKESVSDNLWYRYQAMKTASLLRETMWSMISEIHSTLDFDYAAYTAENLQRFESSYKAFNDLP